MSYVIGVSGGSGSGKTSFIRDLKKHFNNGEVCVLSQDDYYHPIHLQSKDSEGVENFDLPEALDLDAFLRDIALLKSNKVVHRKEYTFNNFEASPKEYVFIPAPVLIVEGLFIFHDTSIFNLLDFTLLIHAKDSDKIIRRIIRDQKERNYPLEDVLYRYKYHVIPAYEKYIDPYKDVVDIVVNNNENYNNALELVKAYITMKIRDK